ncbi:hypothetical protein PUN28_014182 [Cardiocondyla obscurior]|uniref:Uncharacterized protein n=1 Tax=Cardiocondyla obscurior TaxID=286306 RepID=A0AAW2F1A6_9HYME
MLTPSCQQCTQKTPYCLRLFLPFPNEGTKKAVTGTGQPPREPEERVPPPYAPVSPPPRQNRNEARARGLTQRQSEPCVVIPPTRSSTARSRPRGGARDNGEGRLAMPSLHPPRARDPT